MFHKVRFSKKHCEAPCEGQACAADASYQIANGTTVKYNCCKDSSVKVKVGNCCGTVEAQWKPTERNTDTQALSVKHSSTLCAETGKLCSTESLKWGMSKLAGPIGLWTTFDLCWNTQNANKTLKNSTNLHMDDWSLGVKSEFKDLTKLSGLLGQIAFKNCDKGLYYAKYDLLNKTILLGTGFHCFLWKGAKHAVQVEYDLNPGAKKGCCGKPITFRCGTEGKLTDDITLKTRLTCGSECHLATSWIQRFDAHSRFIWTDNINLCKMLCGGCCPTGEGACKTSSPYHFGAVFEYSL